MKPNVNISKYIDKKFVFSSEKQIPFSYVWDDINIY